MDMNPTTKRNVPTYEKKLFEFLLQCTKMKCKERFWINTFGKLPVKKNINKN